MYLDDSIAKLEEFEGAIPWMYQDWRGNVTVGVGRLLSNVSDAAALNFSVNGGRATLQELAAEFTRVKNCSAGQVAARYKCATSPEIDAATMTAMLHAQVQALDGQLQGKVKGYAAAPDAAKIALLDMAYNLGLAGLLKYEHLCDDVAAGDWYGAAGECFRHGIDGARNTWTQEQFKAAAEVAGME